MNREQLIQLATAGTVTFPATFPRLAEIQLREARDLAVACGSREEVYLIAVERPSVKVTIKRILRVADVRAVFLPSNPNGVNPHDGTWMLAAEVEMGLRLHQCNRGSALGIVYVAEQTPTILEVHAGMTAAESAQYYPPLPIDRSVNHYDPYRFSRSHAPAHPSPVTSCEPDYFHYYPYCEPDEPQASAPPAAGAQPGVVAQAGVSAQPAPCEPDYYYPHPSAQYQASQQQQRFEPAPFPSEGEQP